MNILNNIRNSFYNPAFYVGIREQKLGRALKFFFSLITILSVTIAFVFGVKLAPVFSSKNLRQLVDFYPKELSIQIKGGVISTNVAEPYLIKEIIAEPLLDRDDYRNLIVIDTKNNFSIETLKSYSTRILVGKNFVVTAKRPGQFEFNNVSRMPDFSLNQDKIFYWVNLIDKYHLGISLLLFFAIFIGFFWFFSLTLFGLLIIALLIKLLAKLKKIQISYRNSYQIAIYAVTIPLILETIFILGSLRAPFPFFFGIIAIIIAIVNLKE